MNRSWQIWWLVPVVACTPLGVWVYEDPGVTVSRVRVDAHGHSESPVVVALDLRNPNDYVVSTTRVELRLVLDGLAIGQLDQDSSVSVPKGIATVALPLIPNRATTRARLQAFGSGVHRFAIEGRATFTTPVGKRKVRFAQTGELAFGPPEPVGLGTDGSP
ncbi:MAG TPA: LEA type 2 family protein [Gemmatimonadales bacterium]|nr:LEA type 2 family protein [Gemmatimonadales bacterium]